MGGSVKVRTVEREEEVKVPAGTQPDDQAILRNLGVQAVGRSGKARGNQVVHFKLVVPTRASKEQLELIHKLSETEDSKTGPACPDNLLRRFGNFLRTITSKRKSASH